MKKLVFISLCMLIASFFVPVNALAQNSKIDDFFKKYSSQKGASYVEMSKTMLDATFATPDRTHLNIYSENIVYISRNEKKTEAGTA